MAEAAALAQNGVVQVEASGGYGRQRIHLAASNGFSGGYGRSSRSVSAVAFVGAGTGMERDWSAESRIYQTDLPGADVVGALAGTRALQRLGARKPATGAYPVLYDERIANSLIGHLLSAINGAAIARGSSWLRDAMGMQVLPAGLSVIEDPHRPRISGSRPFDGEGLATKRRAIVQDGMLTGWTLDLATGRKLGMPSTANAARGTSSPPSPSTSNIDLTPGTASRADLLRDMGTGLLITSLIGSSVNATTGDYSRGASGFWVDGGEIAYPVNECTIAGNLRDMLMRITPANDARPHLGTRVPSLLVEGLTLADLKARQIAFAGNTHLVQRALLRHVLGFGFQGADNFAPTLHRFVLRHLQRLLGQGNLAFQINDFQRAFAFNFQSGLRLFALNTGGLQGQFQRNLFALGLFAGFHLNLVQRTAAGDFKALSFAFGPDAFFGQRELLRHAADFNCLARCHLRLFALLIPQRPLAGQVKPLGCTADFDLALLFKPCIFAVTVDFENPALGVQVLVADIDQRLLFNLVAHLAAGFDALGQGSQALGIEGIGGVEEFKMGLIQIDNRHRF
jgi:hypothetical protein